MVEIDMTRSQRRRHPVLTVAPLVLCPVLLMGGQAAVLPAPTQPPITLVIAAAGVPTVPAGASTAAPGPSAVGQLFADDSTCTASVVGSASGRVAVTAAHCVYIPPVTDRMPNIDDGREPGWVDDLVFVPARNGDEAPYGIWTVERMWVDRAWQKAAAPEVDVAFLELADSPSGTAEEVLGSLGIRFADPAEGEAAEPTVEILGYPTAPPFDGTTLQRCGRAPTDASFRNLLETPCGLTPGSSGGPWMVPDDGWWSVLAVTSYQSLDRPGSLGAAQLGAVAEELWRAADRAAR